MKLRDMLCLGGLALAAVNSWAADPAPGAPRYFFTVDLDPHYAIVGHGELDAGAAAKSNCYMFTYQPDGKVAKIVYDRAGHPMPDPLFGAAEIDFAYQPGIERRSFLDASGQPVANVLGVQGEELTLNPAGFPITVTNLDANGHHTRDISGVIRITRTLDAQNRLISSRRSGLLGTEKHDDVGLFETRPTYDAQGRRTSRGNFDSSGQPLDDSDGVALTRTTYTTMPDGSCQVIDSYFDEAGMAVENKSTGVHALQQVFDPRGLLLSESYFDATGAPTVDNTSRIHERRCTYDARGNQLTEEFFDPAGNPRDQKTGGFAKQVYQYDDLNRVAQKEFFGDDGKPVVLPALGAAIIRQEYDADGHMVRRQFFDGEGNPSPHVKYGVPGLRISVTGDTTTVQLRDANDELTRHPVGRFASFSYLTATDQPLSPFNKYYDLRGRPMGRLRVLVINPHLAQLRGNPVMRLSAHYGAGLAGLGALLAMALALRKDGHTKHRRIYVPLPLERFLGWLAVFLIIEGSIRFLITIWWAYVAYSNGDLGWGIYALETVVVLFFLYRLPRMLVTMRVLNVAREDIDRLVREFFAKENLTPEWFERQRVYATEPLWVQVRYYPAKRHAYLAFRRHHREGRALAARLNLFIRTQVRKIKAPPRTQAIKRWYRCVAAGYFAYAVMAFYTLWQMVKH